MDFFSVFVDAVKATLSSRVGAGDVIAVIGKLLARGEPRSFADDLVTFDHELAAIGMHDYPFAPEEGDHAVRAVLNRDEVNESVRFVRRKRRAAVVVGEFVEAGGQTGDFAGTARHVANRRGIQRSASGETR